MENLAARGQGVRPGVRAIVRSFRLATLPLAALVCLVVGVMGVLGTNSKGPAINRGLL